MTLYFDEDVEDDVEYSWCVACGGQLVLLGQLGNRVHHRCRNCGLDQSTVESA